MALVVDIVGALLRRDDLRSAGRAVIRRWPSSTTADHAAYTTKYTAAIDVHVCGKGRLHLRTSSVRDISGVGAILTQQADRLYAQYL
jgi:hypothetical protein